VLEVLAVIQVTVVIGDNLIIREKWRCAWTSTLQNSAVNGWTQPWCAIFAGTAALPHAAKVRWLCCSLASETSTIFWEARKENVELYFFLEIILAKVVNECHVVQQHFRVRHMS